MNKFRIPVTTTLCIPGLLLVASTFATAQQHAHTHGRLALNVALGAQSITLQMEVPLDNFLGFERAPRTDAERKQVTDMVARLHAADKLFVFKPEAGCTLSEVKLESAVLELGKNAAPAQGTVQTPTRKGGKEPKEHADIDVDISFACTKADEVRFIDVKLFDAFKNVRAIDAQVAATQGQFQRTLTKAAPKLAWGK